MRATERQTRRRADEVIHRFGLDAFAHTLGSELSTGTRRICDVAAQVAVGARLLLLEATQSMIGFGVQPPTPSLGNMFQNAQSNVTIAPWDPIVSSAVLTVVVIALYAIGDQLRERDRL